MCDSWKKPSPGDLSLKEIARIFNQLPRMDAVRLTGGEPFVRKDMLDIAHLAQRKLRPLVLHVTTNGFLTERIISFCEQRQRDVPLMMLISIDGMKDKHNAVRGRETAWDSVQRTLWALAPRQKELRMRLGVNQTIVDAEGATQYRELHELLRPHGIQHNVVMAYDASATYSLEDEVMATSQIGKFATFGEFTHETIRALLDEVERDLGEFPMLDRMAKKYYLQGVRARLLGEGTVNSPPCVALNTHLRLFPNGDVPTCQFNTRKVGNLKRQSFQELWYGDGDAMTKQRNWVRKCPGCWAECEVMPNAIYSGEILKGKGQKAEGKRKPDRLATGVTG